MVRFKEPNVRQQRRTLCVPHREAREQCTYLRPHRGVFYCSDVVRPFFTAALSLLYEKVASSFTTCRPKPVLNVSGALKEVEYSTFFCHAYHSYTWRPRADNAGPCADVNKRTAARCRRVAYEHVVEELVLRYAALARALASEAEAGRRDDELRRERSHTHR